MRELHSFSDEQLARRFVSVLQSREMPSHVEPEDNSWIIWIENDDHRERARALLTEFQANPQAQEFADAEKAAKKLEQVARKAQKDQRRLQVDIRPRWQGVWWKAYPATFILIGVSVLVVALCTDWRSAEKSHGFVPRTCNDESSSIRNALFIQPPAKIYSLLGIDLILDNPSLWTTLKTGQIWRLVTPIFLHFDGLHILFNMMWLRTLGMGIEFVRGTKRFLVLVLLIAVISNLVQLYWAGPNFGGMSGVVFGLLGYVWMKGRTQPQYGLGLMPDQVIWSMLWMLLCIGGSFGPIANGAHVSGLVVGILIGARQALWKHLIKAIRPSDGGFGP